MSLLSGGKPQGMSGFGGSILSPNKQEPIVVNCCGCLDLKLGSYALSTLMLITSGASIGLAWWNDSRSNLIMDRNDPFYKYGLYASTAIWSLSCVAGILGIVGTALNMVEIVRFYCYTYLVCTFFGGFSTAWNLRNNYYAFGNPDGTGIQNVDVRAFVIMGTAFTLGVTIYFAICVWSYFIDLYSFPERYNGSVPLPFPATMNPMAQNTFFGGGGAYPVGHQHQQPHFGQGVPHVVPGPGSGFR
ncbi:hypothetical protein HDU97_007247 [Phlyctochytrium planicorne]|nr:hypothetical protein HDU97_007247 [Phlyctochytrium planicorne]